MRSLLLLSRLRSATIACCVLPLAMGLAQAQPAGSNVSANAGAGQGTVSAELTQQLVVVENGKEVFKPVSSVKPGDLIEYRVVYTNRSAKPVTDVVADLPIPEGLEYQPRSALPRQGNQAVDFHANLTPVFHSILTPPVAV